MYSDLPSTCIDMPLERTYCFRWIESAGMHCANGSKSSSCLRTEAALMDTPDNLKDAPLFFPMIKI